MASEAKKQRDLLKSGFIDTLGSSFSNKKLEFNALEEVLNKYGAKLVKSMQDNLNKIQPRGGNPPTMADAVASGRTSTSIRFEYTKLNSSYEVVFLMSDTAKFTDEGVQGVDSAKSVNKTSPYKFKFINPSKDHVRKLEQWVKDKNVTSIITVPKGIAKGDAAKGMAFVIGRSIKERGIRATYFKKQAIESLIDEFKLEVAKAVGVDIQVNVLF